MAKFYYYNKRCFVFLSIYFNHKGTVQHDNYYWADAFMYLRYTFSHSVLVGTVSFGVTLY